MAGIAAGADARFASLDSELGQVAAMSAAFAIMANNRAAPGDANLVTAGVGFYGGETAMSVGYSRRLTNGVAISLGGAFGRGGEASGGVGIGFDIF